MSPAVLRWRRRVGASALVSLLAATTALPAAALPPSMTITAAGPEVDGLSKAEHLANILMGDGAHLESGSARINGGGDPNESAVLASFGHFTDGLESIGIDHGLAITANADILDFAGGAGSPNESIVGANSNRSDDDLFPLASDELGVDILHNATSLEFEVMPTADYLRFEYVFAVTEEGEYGDDGWEGYVIDYPDGFGLFIGSGEVKTNCATVPSGPNAGTYLSMANAGIVAPEGSSAANRATAIASPDHFAYQVQPQQTVRFLTVPLTCVADVSAARANSNPVSVKIVVADADDNEVPPAVFLAAGSVSFTSIPPGHEPPHSSTNPPKPQPATPPAPTPQPSTPPVPVRGPSGQLPSVGTGQALVGGKPATVEVVPVPATGGVAVRGAGYELEVSPEGGSNPVRPSERYLAGVDLSFARGQAAEVSVRGFAPRSDVNLWLFSEPKNLGVFETDAAGTLAAVTDGITADVAACKHTLHAEGVLPSGETVELSLGIWVDANPFPFADTSPNSPHARPVACLTDLDVIKGTSASTFAPAGLLTRGQTASLLARMLGLDASGAATHADARGTAHEGAIAAVTSAGVFEGFGDGTFRPGATITRGQLSTVLSKAARLEESATPAYVDTRDSVHAPGVAALAAAGIVVGFPDGSFQPGLPVKRDQAASMLLGIRDHLDELD